MHNAAPITLDTAVNSVQRTPHRGDIWFAELGDHTGTSVQGGCRPVLIISNDSQCPADDQAFEEAKPALPHTDGVGFCG